MAIQTQGQLFDKDHTCQCQLTSLRDSTDACLNGFPRTDILIEWDSFKIDTENLCGLLCYKVKRCGKVVFVLLLQRDLERFSVI